MSTGPLSASPIHAFGARFTTKVSRFWKIWPTYACRSSQLSRDAPMCIPTTRYLPASLWRLRVRPSREIGRGNLLFKVRSDGKEYEIYTSGMVKGFGDDPAVMNLYPTLVASL